MLLQNPARTCWSEAGLGSEGCRKLGAFSHSDLYPQLPSSRAAVRDTALVLLADGKLSLGRS